VTAARASPRAAEPRQRSRRALRLHQHRERRRVAAVEEGLIGVERALGRLGLATGPTLAAYEGVFHRGDPAAFPALMGAQAAA